MDEVKKINTKYLYKYYRANKGTLSYDLFKKVISSFNKEVSVQIIRGYHFRMPYRLGVIKITSSPRRAKINEDGNVIGAVDWGASNKIKTEILKNGGTPYAEVKDETGKKISDNGGEKWMVYHTSSEFYHWIRLLDPLLKNGNLYKFDATWHNDRALIACVDEDSELIYHRAKESGIKKFINKIMKDPYSRIRSNGFDLCNQ